jgi:hypothetical protein
MLAAAARSYPASGSIKYLLGELYLLEGALYGYLSFLIDIVNAL